MKELLYGQPGANMGMEPPNNDLIPSHSVTRLLSILKEILSVASMVESRQTDITKIVSCVIDPLLHSITESASHLPTVDMAVYILNCLYQMQSTLGMFEYVDSRMERLQAQCDAQIDTLTSEQASSLVANLNLGPIYTLLQSSSRDIDPNHLKMFMVIRQRHFRFIFGMPINKLSIAFASTGQIGLIFRDARCSIATTSQFTPKQCASNDRAKTFVQCHHCHLQTNLWSVGIQSFWV